MADNETDTHLGEIEMHPSDLDAKQLRYEVKIRNLDTALKNLKEATQWLTIRLHLESVGEYESPGSGTSKYDPHTDIKECLLTIENIRIAIDTIAETEGTRKWLSRAKHVGDRLNRILCETSQQEREVKLLTKRVNREINELIAIRDRDLSQIQPVTKALNVDDTLNIENQSQSVTKEQTEPKQRLISFHESALELSAGPSRTCPQVQTHPGPANSAPTPVPTIRDCNEDSDANSIASERNIEERLDRMMNAIESTTATQMEMARQITNLTLQNARDQIPITANSTFNSSVIPQFPVSTNSQFVPNTQQSNIRQPQINMAIRPATSTTNIHRQQLQNPNALGIPQEDNHLALVHYNAPTASNACEDLLYATQNAPNQNFNHNQMWHSSFYSSPQIPVNPQKLKLINLDRWTPKFSGNKKRKADELSLPDFLKQVANNIAANNLHPDDVAKQIQTLLRGSALDWFTFLPRKPQTWNETVRVLTKNIYPTITISKS